MLIDDLIAYIFTPFAQVALIIGIAEVAKRLGLPKRWIPLFDVILGMLTGVLAFGVVLEYGVFQGLYVGIAVGLAACGLFSGIKNTIEPKEDNDE